ncbi:MAG: hypothetical protein JO344_11130 [Planctomycetaceae bacterium]|nr:hypothetical protein [Planctomycetaceae bacterium]
MAAATAHPSDQTLHSYGLGKLDDRLAESVVKHLKECDSCRHRVAEVTSDSFVGRLRSASAWPGVSLAAELRWDKGTRRRAAKARPASRRSRGAEPSRPRPERVWHSGSKAEGLPAQLASHACA